jgi:hypothetical protein
MQVIIKSLLGTEKRMWDLDELEFILRRGHMSIPITLKYHTPPTPILSLEIRVHVMLHFIRGLSEVVP